MSTSTSTSQMNCSSCRQLISVNELVDVYAMTSNDYHNSSSRKVCGVCLIGYHIPVIRPSTGKWEFGTVLSYIASAPRHDHYRQQHQIQFTNDTKQWVSVRANPYEAYAQYFNDKLDEIYYSNEASDCPSHLANTSGSSTEQQDHYKQDLYQNESLNEARSSHKELGSPDFHSTKFFPLNEKCFPIDIYQKHLTSTYPSQELSPTTGMPPFVDSPLQTKTQNNFLTSQNHRSSVIQQYSLNEVEGLDSPVDNQICSLRTSSPTYSSSSDSRNSIASFTSSAHRIPRLWTPKEDKLLLKSIGLKNNQLCWPKIALDIPDRTGKQCRERYLNHLGPHLKHTGWSAIEDATIFRLHSSQGSKWSQMVKSLPGRTDNGIKNRFHHLRRRFEKRTNSVPDSIELRQVMKLIETSTSFRSLSPDRFVTIDIAVRILTDSSANNHGFVTGDGEYRFGPFERVSENLVCSRCGLIMPSKETGNAVCRHTGWCKTCTGVSLVLSGDLLRAIHLVRNRPSV